MESKGPGPLVVKDCALASIATGIRARNARELLERVRAVPASSIYHHFWGGLLQARFGDREYNNDFATWARLGLHDIKLAERLGLVDPAAYADLEGLRQELVEVIDDHLYESEPINWSEKDAQFHFIRSQVVVFDTHRRVQRPQDLAEALEHFSVSSVFYHFIDARRRTPQHVDDFRNWLVQWGGEHGGLIDALADVDPYFVPLARLRQQLVDLFREHSGGSP